MTRYLLLTLAFITGTYAFASWICAMLTDAGIAGAISAALVIAAEGIAYCQRQRWERARRTRAEVWERRDTMTFDHGVASPLLHHQHGTASREYRAVWPHEIGGFE